MITQGADVLIIAAIDGTALSSQLQAAADKKIPVIAYDRLIRGSKNVDFYVSFDDNNTNFFFQGAMDTLKPYIDSGSLVVKSKQTNLEQVAILRWQQEAAQKRMEDLLTSSYNDGSKVAG